MSHANSRNGIWKAVAIVLLGMIVTGLSAWLSFGKDSISEPQVNDLITLRQETLELSIRYNKEAIKENTRLLQEVLRKLRGR